MEDHDQRFKTLLQTFFREFIDLFFHNWENRFDWSTIQWLELVGYPFFGPPEMGVP